jgi:ribose transport system substrate-binding protein
LRISVCLVLWMLCAGCARHGEREIAVIPKSTASVFWQSVQAGAIAAGQENRVKITWSGAPLETDYSRQIQILDSMIARHVDGIAVAASERNALNSSLERAASANIPVVIFDSGVDSRNYVTFISTNNLEAGKSAGRALGQLLKGQGTVGEIMHAPGSFSTMDRERGFEDVMAHEFPGIKIVARQFSSGDREKALNVTENILTANPRLEGIFASSEPSSVGAAQALKSRGLTGKVRLVAFDSSQGLIDDLQNGTIDALIAQDPFKLGHDAVLLLTEKLSGQSPPKQVDLSAQVITKADLARPEIHALLYPDIDKWLKLAR